jgi:glutamate---cysteine ligase / carboxylate-amine ligase|uniref:glutamate-cysteine ligase family protein n=1 Tax=Cephaloticoccus sp. TaxID=1985742 RepID=UPI00404A8BD0
MPARFSLFECFGVELEYMIVQRDDLRIAPWSDRVLINADGLPVSDIERGSVTWSNELTAHVIELKTTDPVASLDGYAAAFANEVGELNRRFAPHGAMLLPTAMHPMMRPEEAVLWAHDNNDIYAAFDRIFDCRGHGWSNLQSVHLNLPFADDTEFARLHAAIRLVLPLLPALAASSPIVEGKITGLPDNRLAFYRQNSAKLAELCGRVIPEPVYTEADYNRAIFEPIGRALAPHDPAGVLEPVFSNSRGAIARFDRGSIEIRLLDLQECPAADLAIVRTVVSLLRELVAEKLISQADQQAATVDELAPVFHLCVEQGDAARISAPTLLKAFGWKGYDSPTAHDLWGAAITRLQPMASASPAEQLAQQTYLEQGTLARRMTTALGVNPSPEAIIALYRQLVTCAENNRILRA